MSNGRSRASSGFLYPHVIIADQFSTGLVEKKIESMRKCEYINLTAFWNYPIFIEGLSPSQPVLCTSGVLAPELLTEISQFFVNNNKDCFHSQTTIRFSSIP